MGASRDSHVRPAVPLGPGASARTIQCAEGAGITKLQQLWPDTRTRVRLAGVCWLPTLIYFVAQAVVQAAWTTPYSLLDNRVSDLGATACGYFGRTFVCSPLHAVMNTAFVATGVLLLLGLVLGLHTWPRRRLTMWGLAALFVASIGTILVGLSPENVNVAVHLVGALNIPCGNLAMILLGLAIKETCPRVAMASVVLGGIGFVGLLGGPLLIVLAGHGGGLAERVALYPLIIWAIVLGASFVRGRSEIGEIRPRPN
jgi:hypothetical membrane protein